MGAGEKPALPNAARMIEEAISELHQAQRRLQEEQKKHAPGSPVWHALETIDDRIHDALGRLGD